MLELSDRILTVETRYYEAISNSIASDDAQAKIDYDNANQLLGAERRTLKRVTIEDAIDADKVFSMLMGDDVEPRKNFIVENAHFVKNLDI